MRTVLVILLAVTVVFVPAVQAESCFCGTKLAAESSVEEASSCCADAAACCCAGGKRGDADNGDCLSSCVCTKTQPQASPDHGETIVLAGPSARLRLDTPERALRARTQSTTPEGDLAPPTSRPLLI